MAYLGSQRCLCLAIALTCAAAVAVAQPEQVYDKVPGQQCGGCFTESQCVDGQWPNARCPAGTVCARKDQWYWSCQVEAEASAPAAAAAAAGPAAAAPASSSEAAPAAPAKEAEKKLLAGRKQPGEQCGGCRADGTCEDRKWATCAPGYRCTRKDEWWWWCAEKPPLAAEPAKQEAAAAAAATGPEAASAPAVPPKPVGYQCGGCTSDNNCVDGQWTGTTCAAGLACSRKDQWYWSCQVEAEASGPAPAAAAAGPAAAAPASSSEAPAAPRAAPAKVAEKKLLAGRKQPGEQCGGCRADGTCEDRKWATCAPGYHCTRKDEWWWWCAEKPPLAAEPAKQEAAAAAAATGPEAASAPAVPPKPVGYQCGGCTSDNNCVDGQWAGTNCAAGLACSRKDQWYWSCQIEAEASGPAPAAAAAAPASSSKAASAAAAAKEAEKKLLDGRKQLGEQCGGCRADGTCVDRRWVDGACAPGYICSRKDEWYWFCILNTAAPAPAKEAAAAAGPEAASAPAVPPKPVGYQCGGCTSDNNCVDGQWTGTTCAAGLACSRKDQWYWSCQVEAEASGPAPAAAAAGPAAAQAPEAGPAAPVGTPLQGGEQCGGCRSESNCVDAKWREVRCAAGFYCARKSKALWSCTANAPPARDKPLTPAAIIAAQIAAAKAAGQLPAATPAAAPAPANKEGSCPEYVPTATYRKTSFTDFLNTTVSISPGRPNPDRATGEWIPGRATFYGTEKNIEAAHVACGEPEGQYGILDHGSCGYTDDTPAGPRLPFPKELYAAAADANADYPGSCGRCYEIRCRTGVPQNNGRPMQVSDLIYYRPYSMKDYAGRSWPGNPYLEDDLFFVKCWDDQKTIKIKIGDSCPCKYPIKFTGEIRTQNWCCGGNNHFDISVFAFQQLAHPSYGIMPLEYRPVACDSMAPLDPLPGFINTTIYQDGIQAGWGWRPYFAKNTVLQGAGEGVDGAKGTCATLSQNGAVSFFCRECAREGYQPFAQAKYMFFSIRSNTKSADPYASSTPPGMLPALKVFMMNDEANTYCNKDVVLDESLAAERYLQVGDWFHLALPLDLWECDKGSVGGLANVNRVDFQNTKLRDANVCMDNLRL